MAAQTEHYVGEAGTKTAPESQNWYLSDQELDESRFGWPWQRKATKISLFLVVLSVVVTIAGLLICDASDTCTRKAWRASFWGDHNGGGWCEKSRDNKLLQEETNSLSNFGFVAAGVVCAICAVGDILRIRNRDKEGFRPRNHTANSPFMSLHYSLGLVWSGLGSFMFHGHTTRLTYELDVAGPILIMNSIIFSMALMFISVENKYVRCWKYGSYVALIGIDWLVVKRILDDELGVKGSYEYIEILYTYIGVQICLFLIVAFIRSNFSRNWPFVRKVNKFLYGENQFNWRLKTKTLPTMTLVVVLFTTAYLVQEQLFPNLLCNPDSWFQFHALWHILCACGFLTLYLGLRSEHFDYSDEVDSPNGNVSV
mmetsp:Transcript_4251/g.4776  ORF Transcript_4251/g.4776 Transcript_4251/m.4776 type:complete len:369 (+) Transcript_4251:117-1223(+)